ncbi:MAG: hypothetical protein VX427_12920 [Acidobacteriota bacterium]|nr:hypothetical protein [Acidobacteriota bacterium]
MRDRAVVFFAPDLARLAEGVCFVARAPLPFFTRVTVFAVVERGADRFAAVDLRGAFEAAALAFAFAFETAGLRAAFGAALAVLAAGFFLCSAGFFKMRARFAARAAAAASCFVTLSPRLLAAAALADR